MNHGLQEKKINCVPSLFFPALFSPKTNLGHTAKTISYRQKDFWEPLESESDKKYQFETQQKPSAIAKKISENP